MVGEYFFNLSLEVSRNKKFVNKYRKGFLVLISVNFINRIVFFNMYMYIDICGRFGVIRFEGRRCLYKEIDGCLFCVF